MCGIVGAVAQRDIDAILLEGLRRLEYRGYDSAGVALIDREGNLQVRRRAGKLAALREALAQNPARGRVGIAHTRWATHGAPSEANAHPQLAGGRLAVVHNGIIENHAKLRAELKAEGIAFDSETDTEVAAQLILRELKAGHALLAAVQRVARRLDGAFAILALDREEPETLVAIRHGSPMVIGVGIGEHFLASDAAALVPVTQRFVYLEEGDSAELSRAGYQLYDHEGSPITRDEKTTNLRPDLLERGNFRHYMEKEIHEQPTAIAETLEGRISEHTVLEDALGIQAKEILAQTRAVQIVACGTSFHAALVARYWIESQAKIPCNVEIASEYRYRPTVVGERCLFIAISQSGETADTLAALRAAKERGYLATLGICNVAESSLVREADLSFMTRAGPEIGVASTKAFTTQLTSLMLVSIALAKHRGLSAETESQLVRELRQLPERVRSVLDLKEEIATAAEDFVDEKHALFLGRGELYPIAMEGALKLKEIAYVHAEAYAAGELKHGPLALVDEQMPIVVSVSDNSLLPKLYANLQEVRARGGRLYVFADAGVVDSESGTTRTISLPYTHDSTAAIVHTIPLQLFAYYAAVFRGTDVDQPRNLAKSVTVE